MFKVPNDFEYSTFKDLDKEYKIKPFDKLAIRILTNKGNAMIDMSMNATNQVGQQGLEYQVEFDGYVKLPTLGRIKIDNLTLREAEALIEKEYSNYYIDPYVNITVTNRRIFLFSAGSGSVINLTNDNYTLIEALAATGGISDFGKAYRIKLLRGELNNPQVFIFNIYNLRDMKQANFLLQANDIIYIETKPRYASKLLTELSPYLSLISTAILVYGIFFK